MSNKTNNTAINRYYEQMLYLQVSTTLRQKRMFYEPKKYLLHPLYMIAAMAVSVQYLQKFDMICGSFNL